MRDVGNPDAVTDSGGSRREMLRVALLLLTLIVGGAAGLAAYTWSAVNEREAARETELVGRKLRRAQSRASQEILSGAVWDEAYDRTSPRNIGANLAWVHSNFAGYYRLSFHHDVTLLIEPAGSVRHADLDGDVVAPQRLGPLATAVRPLVVAVQAEEMSRRRGELPLGPKGLGNAASRAAAVRVGSDVYLLAVATIVPTAGAAREDGPASVVVSGIRADAEYLAGIREDLGINPPRLLVGPKAEGEAVAALTDADYRPVATLAWGPARPGMEVLARLNRWILGALLALGATAVALVLRIRKIFRRLAQKDRALQLALADLVEARDQAQAASVAKSEFVANISHEIRTPLNGMLGMVQVLEREPLAPAQHERVRVMRQSGRALLSILDDVLDIAKIEAGQLEIRPGPFRLEDLIASVGQAWLANAEAKALELSWSVGDAGGDWVGDAGRIGQVLLNLVSNAVKFTEAGAVRIEASLSATGLAIRVRDQGQGLTDRDQMLIFEKFSQVDGGATRRAGGTGLGLAISRTLARLMGGDLTVASELGAGSSFTLELPLARAGPHDAIAALTVAPAGLDRLLRVLAAEDNTTNQLVLSALLEPLDIELVIVGNGAEAVEASALQEFDIILMDIQMPVMDGVEATAVIRAREARTGRPALPIIALTANAMSHQRQAYAAAGFTSVVAKPIEAETLFHALSLSLGLSGPGADEASATAARRVPG